MGLQHVMPPNSNWMHVRFQTRMQANKAVAKNGCVLGGSIMVGISSCKDETVLDNLNTSTVLDNSILSSSVANLSTGLGTPRTIRPLAQAYKEAQVENKVVPGTNTPSKKVKDRLSEDPEDNTYIHVMSLPESRV